MDLFLRWTTKITTSLDNEKASERQRLQTSWRLPLVLGNLWRHQRGTNKNNQERNEPSRHAEKESRSSARYHMAKTWLAMETKPNDAIDFILEDLSVSCLACIIRPAIETLLSNNMILHFWGAPTVVAKDWNHSALVRLRHGGSCNLHVNFLPHLGHITNRLGT